MKESIKQEVLQRMLPLLDNAQAKALEQTLETVLCKYMEGKPDENEISDNVQSFSHIFLRLARSSSPLPEIRPSWEAFAHPRSGCLLWFLVTKNSVHS